MRGVSGRELGDALSCAVTLHTFWTISNDFHPSSCPLTTPRKLELCAPIGQVVGSMGGENSSTSLRFLHAIGMVQSATLCEISRRSSKGIPPTIALTISDKPDITSCNRSPIMAKSNFGKSEHSEESVQNRENCQNCAKNHLSWSSRALLCAELCRIH